MMLGGIPVEALEAISSIALTAMSTIVAGVALIFSYRQNVGWKPVLLVSASSLSGIGGSSRYKVILLVEFWNRRKYPVALRDLVVKVSGVETLDVSAKREDGPQVRRNRLIQRLTSLVAPHQHSQFSVEVEFEKQFLDALRPLFCIKVHYFDAHQNRTRRISLDHKFFYPELGWKKSEEERSKIEEAGASFYAEA